MGVSKECRLELEVFHFLKTTTTKHRSALAGVRAFDGLRGTFCGTGKKERSEEFVFLKKNLLRCPQNHQKHGFLTLKRFFR